MKVSSSARLLLSALWPCVFYFVCSFAMNMLTKALLTSYQWRAIFTLGAIQNVFTAASLGAFLGAQYLRQRRPLPLCEDAASTGTASAVSDQDKDNGSNVQCVCAPAQVAPSSCTSASLVKRSHRALLMRVVVPLVVLHVGNMLLGFAAMRVVNMPMYLVLRRLTTIKILLIEWLVLCKPLSTGIKLALLISTTGSLIAGCSDATFHGSGYLLVLCQNVFSACSLTFSKESHLSSTHIILINSVAGSFLCCGLAYFYERDLIRAFPAIHDLCFLAVMLLMCCFCVLYQFAIITCTIRNSALATSVTGNIKDLASTICGFLLFPDVHIRLPNVVGVALSLLGAYLFSYLKFLSLTAASRSLQSAKTSEGTPQRSKCKAE